MAVAFALAGVGTVASGTTHNLTGITLSANTGRRIVVSVSVEAAVTFSSPAFDGTAMTPLTQRVFNTMRCQFFELEIPDVKGSGSYDFTSTSSASALSHIVAWEVTGAASGSPLDQQFGTANSGTDWTCTVTVQTDGGVLATSVHASGAASITLDTGGTLVERGSAAYAGGFAAKYGDAVITSGTSKTLTSTATTSSSNRIINAISYAPAGGGGGGSNAPRSAFYHLQGMR